MSQASHEIIDQPGLTPYTPDVLIIGAAMACNIIEGLIPASEDVQIRAWQYLIDTGIVWELQGWYGRTAYELIQQGICHPCTAQALTQNINQ